VNNEKNKLKRKKILLILTLITSIIYIGWRILFTIPTQYGILSLIAGISLIVAESISMLEAAEHYKNMSRAFIPEMPEIPVDWFPHVDVYIATHNESTDLLYKTINGCKHMNYPDMSRVHIHVCDDCDRSEMKVGYFGLSENEHAKAGNLNNAISKTSSPLVATFDADMIPHSSFLLETVPYFFLNRMEQNDEGIWRTRDEETDLKIGFIQTPQSFYNPDLFQFNLYSEKRIPNEQDYFFREVNVGRNRTNSPIYAGTNTLISREALDEVGGITTGTITEDFATGIKIQSKGYTCYAIDKTLAHGLAPTSIKSLIKQRERWGRGCVQTVRKLDFITNKDLKPSTKISYFASFMYWWTFLRRFVYILSPILFTVFHIRVVECSFWELLLIWLPSYICYNETLKVISGNIRNQRWSNVIDTIIFPYLIIPVMMESLGFKLKKFAVTKKDRSVVDNESNMKYAIPHIILIVFSLLGLVISVKDAILGESLGNIIVIYWLIVNLYGLIMAVFFMYGRKNYRQHERFEASMDVSIMTDSNTIDALTSDISEKGLAVILDYPEYVSYEDQLTLVVDDGRYNSRMKAKLVHVSNLEKGYKYSFRITEISSKDKKEYFQLVYDRSHSLPTYLSSAVNIVGDFNANITGRYKKDTISNRKMPRIYVNKMVGTSNGVDMKLLDLNYEYVLIERIDMNNPPINHIELFIDSVHKIKCTFAKEIMKSPNSKKVLYRITNSSKIKTSPEFRHALENLGNDDNKMEFEKKSI
jgi:cellulose synthase (UDP-forming)